jgi:prepilin-type processing-associated H-X9-DG protein
MSTQHEESPRGNIETRRKRGGKLRTILKAIMAGVLLIGLGLAILLPAIGSAREAARRSTCQCRLKQIGLALHNYLAAEGSFPPAYTIDADGRPMHSWRALILPYFEGNEATTYDYSKAWDSPENLEFAQNMPKTLRCASDDDAPPGTTNYVAVVGDRTVWPNAAGRKPDEIADGLSNTIAVVEVSGLNIPWTKPEDLQFDKIPYAIDPADVKGISSRHGAGANFLMADGSVRFLQKSIDANLLRALLTVADGESVSPP